MLPPPRNPTTVPPSAIVLSYFGEQFETFVPYFRALLQGLPVTVIVGRAESGESPSPPDHALYFRWRDALLRFYNGEKWWSETLFSIFEEERGLTKVTQANAAPAATDPASGTSSASASASGSANAVEEAAGSASRSGGAGQAPLLCTRAAF